MKANGEKASKKRTARGLKAIDEELSFVKFATLKKQDSVFTDQQVVKQLLYFQSRSR